MSDKNKDVLIAAYLFEDLAKQDFDAVLKLAEQKMITVEGVVLVQKDAGGELHVTETGDHLGRKGATIGGASASSSASSHRHCWPRPRSERPPAPSWASSPNTGWRAASPRKWTQLCRQARAA
jgi:hypothetical protein